jgi:uncharacterized protein
MDTVDVKGSPSSATAAEAGAKPGPSLTENAVSGNSSKARAARRPINCGDLDIWIARDGTWFYMGSPIGRQPLVKLFASVLRREADGYWLVTPAERGRIQVEDAPFVAVAVERDGDGPSPRLIFRTNLDEFVTLGPDHPLRVETESDGQPVPYIRVRDGLDARLARPVFYELVDLGVEQPAGGGVEFGIWSCGVFFRLGIPDADWE